MAATLLLLPTLSAQPATTEKAARLRIEGVRQSLGNVRITDLAGREVAAELDAREEGSAVSLSARREPLLIRPRAVEQVKLEPDRRIIFEGGLVVPVGVAVNPGAAGSKGGGGTPPPERAVWYRLSVTASPLPAVWQADRNAYRTTLAFSLSRPAELPAELPAETPVVIRLGFDGLAADEPPPITLRHAGLEHEQAVPLHFQVLTESPKILVRSTFADADLALRALPRLELRPQHVQMLGFGLESVPMFVTAVHAHGGPRMMETPLPVALELSGRARADPAQPIIDAGAHTTSFQVRSAGWGPLQLKVTAEGLTSEATISQRLPVAALIATLGGGALGGAARRFSPRARKNLTKRRVVEGMVVGLIAFVAGLLGVGYLHLPPALITTEAGAFLIAALCGFAGVTVLETMLPKTKTAAA